MEKINIQPKTTQELAGSFMEVIVKDKTAQEMLTDALSQKQNLIEIYKNEFQESVESEAWDLLENYKKMLVSADASLKGGNLAEAQEFINQAQAFEYELRGKEIALGMSPERMEAIKQTMNTHMAETFGGNAEDYEAEFINPDKLDYEQLANIEDNTKPRKYSLNPETQNLKFEEMKTQIIDPSKEKDEKGNNFLSQPHWKFLQYIQKTILSTGKFYAPGLEYQRWSSAPENIDKIPAVFKDNSKYFQEMGSFFRFSDGHARVPNMHWFGKKLDSKSDALENGFSSSDLVVLLEK